MKKFRVLRGISTFYKVVSVLVIAVALLVFCLTLATSADYMTIGEAPMLLVSLIPGTLIAVGLYGIGEIIELFISIEENTRATRIALTHLAKTNPAAFDEHGPRVVRSTEVRDRS